MTEVCGVGEIAQEKGAEREREREREVEGERERERARERETGGQRERERGRERARDPEDQGLCQQDHLGNDNHVKTHP